MDGGLIWIPKALSTLRPATSPRLLAIRLCFVRPSTAIEIATGEVDDLRRVAGELARIEREFEGTVELTVYRDSEFDAVSDTLHVRSRFRGDDTL